MQNLSLFRSCVRARCSIHLTRGRPMLLRVAQLRQDLLGRLWQPEQCSASAERLAEELLRRLFHAPRVKPQEGTGVRGGDLDEVELRGQSHHDAHQRANGPTDEGKTRWDAQGLPVEQLPNLLQDGGET